MKKFLSILALSSLMIAGSVDAQSVTGPHNGSSSGGGGVGHTPRHGGGGGGYSKHHSIGKYTSEFYCTLIDGYAYLNNGKLKPVSVRAINQALASSKPPITATPTAAQLNLACGYATGLMPAKNSEGLCLAKQGTQRTPCGFEKQLPLCVGFECYDNEIVPLVK